MDDVVYLVVCVAPPWSLVGSGVTAGVIEFAISVLVSLLLLDVPGVGVREAVGKSVDKIVDTVEFSMVEPSILEVSVVGFRVVGALDVIAEVEFVVIGEWLDIVTVVSDEADDTESNGVLLAAVEGLSVPGKAVVSRAETMNLGVPEFGLLVAEVACNGNCVVDLSVATLCVAITDVVESPVVE